MKGKVVDIGIRGRKSDGVSNVLWENLGSFHHHLLSGVKLARLIEGSLL